MKTPIAIKTAALLTIVLMASALAGAPGKAVTVKAKKAVACAILPYDFDSVEKELPRLDLPDNALLALAGEDYDFKPGLLIVSQNGIDYAPEGYGVFYMWGVFYAIYYPTGFGKFDPFDVKYGEATISVGGDVLAGLRGGAKPRGKKSWVDPVTDIVIRNAPPVELPELIARGKGHEIINEALDLRGDGGLPAVRAAALKAFEAKDYLRAALLAGESVKWSKALDPLELRSALVFHDWVVIARSLMALNEPLAAVLAFDEALRVRKDKSIESEREKAWREYGRKGAAPTVESEPFRDGLIESEMAAGNHGKLPIPQSERGVIREGSSADGVFIGDHRDRILAQCGAPVESFSGMILFTGHPSCPEAVFFGFDNRSYAVRSTRGKTQRGIGVGDKILNTQDIYGKPDRKESMTTEGGKKSGAKWIYIKPGVAFIDLDGDGSIDAIEVFNYSMSR